MRPAFLNTGTLTRRVVGTASAVAGVAIATVAAAGFTPVAAQETLGTVDFRVSCSDTAQVQFNRAVALLHHMTYPRAREVFEQVARIDPRCAMAQWGIAMTLFQPLWPTRPGARELRQGWDAAQTASRLNPPTERERLLVGAVAAFFQNPESTDYWQRIRRWEAAMADAYRAFSRDQDVTAFYALAHLAAAASDEQSVAEHSARAATLLLAVLHANPDHPGAMHYLVHANDAQGREHNDLDVTRKYAASAPRNAHALHMPTHIETRLGNWNAVVAGNLLAADAALANPAGDRGQFVWDEFPHAVEYVVYGYLQQGADSGAETQLTRLYTTAALQPTFKTAFHLASTRARYVLERKAWGEAAALVPRQPASLDWDQFPWPESVTWFARGLGAVHERRTDDAQAAIEALGSLERKARGAGEELFARNIRVLYLEVCAWLAAAVDDTVVSEGAMREASALELATPKHAVTPAPTIPAYELWGDLLLDRHDGATALRMYRRSLELYPGRFNSLLGAARAALVAGDPGSARTYYQQLLDAAGGSTRAALSEARAFLGSTASGW